MSASPGARLMLALGVMSLPLLVLFARVAFEEVIPCLQQIARALGGFGATIMVASNIPGKTSTLSLRVWDTVGALAFREPFVGLCPHSGRSGKTAP